MPSFLFTVGELGLSSFRVALPWRSDTKSRHKKTSLRVSSEVVEFTLNETRSEANALCAPLPSAVIREILYVSLDDCLQHCKLLFGGFLPALFIRHSPSGRRRIVLTVYWLVPFIVSFHDLRLVLLLAGSVLETLGRFCRALRDLHKIVVAFRRNAVADFTHFVYQCSIRHAAPPFRYSR